MLVLTRKPQERIRIGDQITITVLRMKGKTVRLGIEAPADVSVLRGELAFDADRQQPKHEDHESEAASASGPATADGRRSPSMAPRTTESWPSQSPVTPTRDARSGSPPTQISFERIPREKLVGPHPIGAPAVGPLRALLDQRTTTTT